MYKQNCFFPRESRGTPFPSTANVLPLSEQRKQKETQKTSYLSNDDESAGRFEPGKAQAQKVAAAQYFQLDSTWFYSVQTPK